MSLSTPFLNLIVIRSENIDRTASFYQSLGFRLAKHQHGKGPEHYSSEGDDPVFEIYPLGFSKEKTTATRLGFAVGDVDTTVRVAKEMGAEIISPPKDSEWGRRAVIKDPEGHSLELVTPIN